MTDFDYTRRIYDSIARAYHEKRNDPQAGAWNEHLEMPAMRSLLMPLVKGRNVLDLGCGTGLLSNQISKWGGHAVGIDLSAQMVSIAQEEYPKIEFHVGQSDALPFDDGRFEVVASSLVMHYLQDLLPTFAEVARVLVSGGEFVFSMHHPLNESMSYTKTDPGSPPTLAPYFHNDSYTWRMCEAELLSYHHTFEDVVRSLNRAGFTLNDLIECRPDENSAKFFVDFEFTSQYPSFCVLHAHKPA